MLAHLELHPVDFRQKTRCRQVIVCGVRLNLPQTGPLTLQMADPFQSCVGRRRRAVIGRPPARDRAAAPWHHTGAIEAETHEEKPS